jgi:hypothetical protein
MLIIPKDVDDRRVPSNLDLLQAIEGIDKRVGKLESKWNVLMGVLAFIGVVVLPLADMAVHLVIK